MEAIHLSPEDRARMNASAAKSLVRILSYQFFILVVISLLVWLLASFNAMWSCLAGGLVYLIPSALVIMQMLLRIYSGVQASVVSIFIYEAIKIGGTIVLLGLLVKFAGDMIVWPALILGLIAVFKGYLLLVILKKV